MKKRSMCTYNSVNDFKWHAAFCCWAHFKLNISPAGFLAWRAFRGTILGSSGLFTPDHVKTLDKSDENLASRSVGELE